MAIFDLFNYGFSAAIVGTISLCSNILRNVLILAGVR